MRLQVSVLQIVGASILAMPFHAGCGSHMRLAGIPNPSLSLFLPEPGGNVLVTVLPQEKDVQWKGPCKLPAPNARASLNGVPLTRLRGTHVGDDMAYDRDCIVEFGGAFDSVPQT